MPTTASLVKTQKVFKDVCCVPLYRTSKFTIPFELRVSRTDPPSKLLIVPEILTKTNDGAAWDTVVVQEGDEDIRIEKDTKNKIQVEKHAGSVAMLVVLQTSEQFRVQTCFPKTSLDVTAAHIVGKNPVFSFHVFEFAEGTLKNESRIPYAMIGGGKSLPYINDARDTINHLFRPQNSRETREVYNKRAYDYLCYCSGPALHAYSNFVEKLNKMQPHPSKTTNVVAAKSKPSILTTFIGAMVAPRNTTQTTALPAANPTNTIASVSTPKRKREDETQGDVKAQKIDHCDEPSFGFDMHIPYRGMPDPKILEDIQQDKGM
jgi:hypothetical protein